MARPRKYDDDTLLESLRSTFLELGPGASSQELAKRAGVSEGTLFKRFGTKRRLFAQAMRMPAIEDQAWLHSIQGRVGRGSFEAHVAELALAFMGYMAEIIPVMEIVMTSGKMRPSDLRGILGDEDASPIVVHRRFEAYFRGEMEAGRLRELDPRTLGDFLLGACLMHVHLRHHLGDLLEPETLEQAASRFARSVVQLGGSGA